MGRRTKFKMGKDIVKLLIISEKLIKKLKTETKKHDFETFSSANLLLEYERDIIVLNKRLNYWLKFWEK